MKKWLFIALFLFTAVPAYSATQFDFLLSQVRTSTTSLVGGKVYFYKVGTTTAKTIWVDRNELTVAANPYTLDSNGTAQIYGSGTYRIVIKDSAGVTKYDRDNITVVGEDGTTTTVDATSGNQAVSLPAGGVMSYFKTDHTANTVTITPSVGGQTINGLSSYILTVGGEGVHMSLSGTVWFAL
jgi:hypothetical protein